VAQIEVKNFSFAYPGGQAVITNFSFQVEKGAFCLLLGPTGSGKTTLLRALKPELHLPGDVQGSIAIDGKQIYAEGMPKASLDTKTSAEKIGFVMQDPGVQIVCDRVWHELAFGLENLGVPQDLLRRRVAELVHFFGIEPWVNAKTGELSDGQKQIVNLASVMAVCPEILLLDEPTAQLDPNAQDSFLNLLDRLNRELGITVIMATHNPVVAAKYASQTVALGPCIDAGPRSEVESLLFPRWEARRKCSLDARPALRLKNLYFRYDRESPWVLRGLNLEVGKGTVHVLVGGNGSGKTSLIKTMAQIEKPQRGKVESLLGNAQAYLPQDPKTLFVCDTVAEEMQEWQKRLALSDEEVQEALSSWGLTQLVHLHPYDLSGGEQEKLALAKLFLTKPELVFLDEPTKGLDACTCADLADRIQKLSDAGTTFVVATHNLDFAEVIADEISMVFNAELACTDFVSDFFDQNLIYRSHDESPLFGAYYALKTRS
jgi:energy-coupling factor transporter ATP-binding protein EcfA2